MLFVLNCRETMPDKIKNEVLTDFLKNCYLKRSILCAFYFIFFFYMKVSA